MANVKLRHEDGLRKAKLWVRTYDPIDYSEMNTLFQVRKGLAIWEGEQDSGILDKTES